ncbi:MAG: stage III sporulation protein SpoIIIAB [Clostridiaceae bacterium]
MIFKILGGILIILTSSYFGFSYSNRYKKRNSQLLGLESAITILQNEILYTHTALPEALVKVSLNSITPINELFNYISEDLYSNSCESVYASFKSGFNKIQDNLFLKEEDKNIILNLSKSLGDSDLEGERKIFNICTKYIERQIVKSEELMKKNVKMYRYLGFALGSALVILII